MRKSSRTDGKGNDDGQDFLKSLLAIKTCFLQKKCKMHNFSACSKEIHKEKILNLLVHKLPAIHLAGVGAVEKRCPDLLLLANEPRTPSSLLHCILVHTVEWFLMTTAQHKQLRR